MFATGAPTSTGAAWVAAVAVQPADLPGLLGLLRHRDRAGRDARRPVPRELPLPVPAPSAREFWQRWHISLGSWFRDYLYIPLGGSRVRPLLLWRNLLIVWGLTGLWHGAAWTFIFWGLYYGVVIGLERSGTATRWPSGCAVRPARVRPAGRGRRLGDLPRRRLAQAVEYYRAMVGLGGVPLWDSQAAFAVARSGIVVLVAVLVSAGVGRRAMDAAQRGLAPEPDAARHGVANATPAAELSSRRRCTPRNRAGVAVAGPAVDRAVASDRTSRPRSRPPRPFHLAGSGGRRDGSAARLDLFPRVRDVLPVHLLQVLGTGAVEQKGPTRRSGRARAAAGFVLLGFVASWLSDTRGARPRPARPWTGGPSPAPPGRRRTRSTTAPG